ncbi:MAG: aminoglycoside 6'-N-acetyltransferase [Devosia sp.]
MEISLATEADAVAWLELRLALWPGNRREEFVGEIAQLLADPGDTINLIARSDNGEAIGLAEAALRHDYVNGCETSPVAFLEGIYVSPNYRRSGVGRRLVDRIAEWAVERGCTEFASDADIDNAVSHAMHNALGFAETQRVVYFRKVLD